MGDQTITLYHGSPRIIEAPFYGGGKPYNDYGQGFYCTESLELAREWSVDAGQDGFANQYELETEGLDILHLNNGNYTILHWLTILLENRLFPLTSPLAKEARAYLLKHFHVPYRKKDLIIGYRADDSYFSFAADFVNGTISVEQLTSAMYLGKLGEQIVLKSRKCFQRLHFSGYEPVDSAVWFPKKRERDEKARKQYFSSDRMTWKKGELYITRILEEEIKPGDERIQRIIY